VKDFSKFVDTRMKSYIVLVTGSKPNNADILNTARLGSDRNLREKEGLLER
jgi:hypothetical protein